MTKSVYSVVKVNSAGFHLKEVKSLWRRNSATLGFFPDGAFEDHAQRGYILGAVDTSNNIVGYLTYRISGPAAVIVHLCVSENFRGHGIAKLLVNQLRIETSFCNGIRITCRSDYEANNIWPRLHFTPRNEKPAREDGRILKTWWCGFGKSDLFSAAIELPTAALDANVFFDLLSPDLAATEESLGLRVTWIEDMVKLSLAPEIFNEIDRNKIDAERIVARSFTESFHILNYHPDKLETSLDLLNRTLAPSKNVSDKSDKRQLAGAIAGGAAYFVTRDEALLESFSEIFLATGIVVLRPSHLISLTNEEINGATYQPARLGAIHFQKQKVRASDESSIVKAFLAYDRGEKKVAFLAVLRAKLSKSPSDALTLVNNSEEKPIALYNLDSSHKGTSVVDLLRIKSMNTEKTLTEHILWHLIKESAKQGIEELRITESYLTPTIRDVLARLGFIEFNGSFSKFNLFGTQTIETMNAHLMSKISKVRASNREPNIQDQFFLETVLWPCKASNGKMNNFIVPIRPTWAMNLFDEESANEDLFGADPLLITRSENIYYRSARPRMPDSPSRVLWYVSEGKNQKHSSQLVACSYVTSVHVGTAKDIFKKFNRLGIYQWKDALAVAKGNPQGKILAFTFGHTELLKSPLPWKDLRSILAPEKGAGVTLASPIRISLSMFNSIYKRCSL